MGSQGFTEHERRATSASGWLLRCQGTLLACVITLVVSLVLGQGAAGSGDAPSLVVQLQSLSLEAFFAAHLYHGSGLHLLGSLLFLGLVGSALEERWGTARFLVFYLLSAWGTSLVTLVTQVFLDEPGPACGSGGVVLALLAVVGRELPRKRLLGSLPPLASLVWIAIPTVSIGLVLLRLEGPGYFLLPQLAGAPLGLLLRGGGGWIVKVRSDWLEDRARSERARLVEIHARVDRLLAKISATGIASLSRQERSFLRAASKHYRLDPSPEKR